LNIINPEEQIAKWNLAAEKLEELEPMIRDSG
jgi:hypothetical protein